MEIRCSNGPHWLMMWSWNYTLMVGDCQRKGVRPEYKVYKKTRCQTDVRQVCGWDFQCAGSKCKEKIPKPRKSSTFVMTHNLHKYVNTRIMEIVWHTDWHFLTCILTELFIALILLIWLICVQTAYKRLQTITNNYKHICSYVYSCTNIVLIYSSMYWLTFVLTCISTDILRYIWPMWQIEWGDVRYSRQDKEQRQRRKEGQ